MLRTAQQKGADMCLAEYVFEYENGARYYRPSEELRNSDIEYDNSQILDKFIKGHGFDFSWQLTVTKLTKASVFQKALPSLTYLSQKCGHLIMCEDIAYSISLYMFAEKVVNCHNVQYYYFKHATQSVNVDDSRKFVKSLTDITHVFEYFEHILKLQEKFSEYQNDFTKFKERYYLSYSNLALKKGWAKEFTQITGEKARSYSYNTFPEMPLADFGNKYDEYEEIIDSIMDKDTSVVSFDIFDTLILRSTFFPKDVFVLLAEEMASKLSNSFFCDFAHMRMEAEKNARLKHSHFEVTLDEIYDYIVTEYGMDEKLANELKSKEMEIELKVSLPRKTGKDLYDIAMLNSKKIVYVSDMYLPKEFIYLLLQKNGYSAEHSLFLSNERKKSKGVGNIYEDVLEEYRIKPWKVVHIGDNMHSDVLQAQKHGLKAFLLPNAKSMCEEHLIARLLEKNNTNIDFGTWKEMIGLKQMYAVIANELYDFPFFNIFSEFQCSTRFLGYYALGMTLFSLCNWIIENVDKDAKVHFVARDGYLPKLAYDNIQEKFGKSPNSNYLYLSRASLLPLSIKEPKDLYSMVRQLNVDTQCIDSILQYFPKDCLRHEFHDSLTPKRRRKNFHDADNFFKQQGMLANCIDFERLHTYQTKIQKYFSQILKKDDILVDIGYNGRAETILSSLLGYSLNSLYMHNNSDLLYLNDEKAHSQNKCFFKYKPKVTGTLRELLFSNCAPSCIGYSLETNDLVAPQFDEKSFSDEGSLNIVSQIQSNAMNFIEDLLEHNRQTLRILKMFPKEVACLPMETFFHNADDKDKKLFDPIMFEDMLGIGTISIRQGWDKQISSVLTHQVNINTYISNLGTLGKIRIIANILLPVGTRGRRFAKKCEKLIVPKNSARRNLVKKFLKKIKRWFRS